MRRTLKNGTTKFVVGIHSAGIIYFEAESLEEARKFWLSEPAHRGICIYTREEWLR